MKPSPERKRENGHAVVEVALMAPWIFFLFVAIFDFGFYAHALISVENAARVAAHNTSTSNPTLSDSSGACQNVLDELRRMVNVPAATTCPVCARGADCTAGPITVRATALAAADSPDGAAPATRVMVRYRTAALIPIPLVLPGELDITRVVQMRQRE